MREILFRGKTERGNWIYGFYTKGFRDPAEEKLHDMIYMFSVDGKTHNWGFNDAKVISKTVGQFTGLTDKSGKKIFEGDIVKTKFGRLCVVEWRSTQCFCGFDFTVCICNANNKTKAPSEFDLYLPENLEIIGNIHDNPELLGE